jgi:hypothetical protein
MQLKEKNEKTAMPSAEENFLAQNLYIVKTDWYQ